MKLNYCGMARGEYEIANRTEPGGSELLQEMNPSNVIDLRNLIQ